MNESDDLRLLRSGNSIRKRSKVDRGLDDEQRWTSRRSANFPACVGEVRLRNERGKLRRNGRVGVQTESKIGS